MVTERLWEMFDVNIQKRLAFPCAMRKAEKLTLRLGVRVEVGVRFITLPLRKVCQESEGDEWLA